jgi:hypothetical protein
MPLEDWIPQCQVARFLYDWQTIIAGLAALLAAFIAVVIPEWRAREALRASLATEIRLYVDLLIKTRDILARSREEFRSGKQPQRDLAALAILHSPTVFPAAAGGTMGLSRRPRGAAVVEFYATVERLNFAARAISNVPSEKVEMSNYSTLIEKFEEACCASLPLLSELPFDERDAVFRTEIAKWGR